MAALAAEMRVGAAGQHTLLVALAEGTDISIHCRPYDAHAVSALSLPPCTAAPLSTGGWVGSVDRGASVNCPQLTIVPHGSGTHTEMCGHVLPGAFVFGAHVPFPPGLMVAAVVTVSPVPLITPRADYPSSAIGDLVITSEALQKAFAAAVVAGGVAGGFATPLKLQEVVAGGALIVRTLPNADSKPLARWTGTNPPYFTADAIAWLLAAGIEHLVTDLPSLDREVRCYACGRVVSRSSTRLFSALDHRSL
jgi:arylformamidase